MRRPQLRERIQESLRATTRVPPAEGGRHGHQRSRRAEIVHRAVVRISGKRRYTQPRAWTPERVIEDYRRWHRLGLSHIRSVDIGLSKAAKRYFGSVDNAMEAAGLAVGKGRWTKRRVLETIQKV
jgi:hypothetical protein